MEYFLKKNIINLHYKTINFVLFILHKVLFKKVEKTKVKKILIFRTGSLGDNICAMPVFNLVKKHFFNSEIHILTNSSATGNIGLKSLINSTYFDKIIDYRNENKERLFKELKNEKYDLFIELTQVDSFFTRLVRNMVIVKLLGIKSAFRWNYHISYVFPKFQEKHFTFPNETKRLLTILEQNGINTQQIKYAYPENISRKETINNLFAELNTGKLIGIAIGGKLKRNKWPLKNYAEICSHFTQKDYTILIFGGKEDFDEAEKLATKSGIQNLTGKLLPLESIEAMKKCQLVISNDTGTVHMAYSVNTPVIGIYSSREYPGKWFPPQSNQNYAFRSSNVSCSICWRKGVNLNCADNICVKQISPDAVIKKAEEIIALID